MLKPPRSSSFNQRCNNSRLSLTPASTSALIKLAPSPSLSSNTGFGEEASLDHFPLRIRPVLPNLLLLGPCFLLPRGPSLLGGPLFSVLLLRFRARDLFSLVLDFDPTHPLQILELLLHYPEWQHWTLHLQLFPLPVSCLLARLLLINSFHPKLAASFFALNLAVCGGINSW